EGSTPMQRFHGAGTLRGLGSMPQSTLFEGRFGRMFRNLAPFGPDDEVLEALADTMFEPAAAPGPDEGADSLNNPDIPAGFTYLGQFVDHDITFDPASKLMRENDPNALHDFRTPRFDLDSVYGRGPSDNPFLYEPDGVHLRIGKIQNGEPDLPRTAPGEGGGPRRALIGDPRNDENVIVSQIQLAFLKFHNKVADGLATQFSGDQLFDEARRVVRWHYQWVVIHDFLTTIVSEGLVEDILGSTTFMVEIGNNRQTVTIPRVNRHFYHWHKQPFMPVEFSVAAYRFGHSMVRPRYDLNAVVQDLPIFDPSPAPGEFADLRGFRERPPSWGIEWHRFFQFPAGNAGKLQQTRLIDTKLSPGLRTLPLETAGVADPNDPMRSLARRNLLRGKALGLPSGQDMARAMGLPETLVLSGDQLGLEGDLATAFNQDSPLWFYILREAEVLNNGRHLGPVGGRIVAEVLIGLLEGDPSSYLSVEPNWQPTLGPNAGAFTMVDLLTFASDSGTDQLF
ncbi:MAG TPA: heme peroxidase family protein, partial [Dehalococcoidia bacterium]|nr:heme peroxidase family protein [Dehalococcoidia bacterium]